MPALDRAILALSRLRGLAEFHSNDDIGFSEDQIAQLMDMISCLILVSHNALALVTAELELFVAFSAWLRSLIDRLALPAQAEEQAEKEPNLSMAPVLDYITNHMLTSPLDLHFGKASEADWNGDWKIVFGEQVSYSIPPGALLDKLEAEMEKVDGLGVEVDMLGILQDRVTRRREGKKDQQPPPERDAAQKGKQKEAVPAEVAPGEAGANGSATYMKAFPKLEFLTKILVTHANQVLRDIAQSGRRHVHLGPMTRLSVGLPIDRSEVTMAAIMKPVSGVFIGDSLFEAICDF